jgi:hypothetical protein
MKPPRQSLFVERRTYRLRRVMDAARILPVLGIVLFLLPLLWSPEVGARRNLAVDAIYIFAIWLGLIVAARLLAPRLDADSPPQRRED